MSTGTFKVDLGGMGLLAARTGHLARLTDDIATRVRKYALPGITSAGTGFYIESMNPGLKHLWGQAESFGRQSGRVVDILSQLISGARAKYERKDADAGASFDALIDDLGAPNAQAFGGRPKPAGTSTDLGCTWPEDPYIRDGAPAANDKYKFEFNVSTGDLFSVSAWVSQLCEAVFDGDPVELFMKPFIGDWDALWASGVEFERYGKSLLAIGHDMQWLSDQIPRVWDGNAAANCREQMLDLGGKLAACAPSFTASGKAFKDAAEDAWNAYDFTSAWARDAIDMLIPIAGAAKKVNFVVGKLPAEAQIGLREVRKLYDRMSGKADMIDRAVKGYNAIPQGVNAPELKIPGYSVTLGGWFHSSKQGPYSAGK
ncbi:hypothetical protein Afil01_54340 [Actinorhabdospora filicis]|uniref:Uncharacterized protein n=1 Tax=Actinorhabdospora filicis TaxID=1785913 RepID=A0A9W6SRQ8_9ACTN|nr:hypothetical protein [Actinorhabdospora filicis]GLZ80627.1 hypothetical protein Afil01_54340 [Actinorhabdospora filicis]